MSRVVSKKEAAQQQLQHDQQRDFYINEEEKHASAGGSAGLNLNIFGALSGALSSTSRKTTHHEPDGSSTQIDERATGAQAQGAAHGQGQAYAQAGAESGSRKGRGVLKEQESGSKKVEESVDHLGIEG